MHLWETLHRCPDALPLNYGTGSSTWITWHIVTQMIFDLSKYRIGTEHVALKFPFIPLKDAICLSIIISRYVIHNYILLMTWSLTKNGHYSIYLKIQFEYFFILWDCQELHLTSIEFTHNIWHFWNIIHTNAYITEFLPSFPSPFNQRIK